MESRTYLKNIRVSPKKLRFLLPGIVEKKPIEALDYLFYIQSKSARILHKAIKSAIANAKHTLKADEDLLKFKLFTIEQGSKIKRYRAGGRGTAKPIIRKLSHIKIYIEEDKTSAKKSLSIAKKRA
jgi:large subunit ribosomal protein L22